MLINKNLVRTNSSRFYLFMLIFVASLVLLYTFKLSFDRYQNFEFGKFDLGNMSQIVWNTSRGNFMEVTDQFGGNMSRVGMSHVDWILALLAPIYWIFPHPMVLVFIQNLFIISGCIPLFLVIKKFTGSSFIGFISGLTYLFYPAHGFLLIWSEYHGVAHVAPLLIWMFWYLDRANYKFTNYKQSIIFWALFIVMLSGKEQIGFIIGLAGFFVFFRNRKLGLQMFIVGVVYSLFCFLILIPQYVPERDESVKSFLSLIDYDSTIETSVTGDNFFLNRYTYLGSSYGEIIKNIISSPHLIFEVWFEEDKTKNLGYLYGPLGYVILLFPFWLIALPDYLIALMADVKGFLSIENQRVSMIVASLFVNYALFIFLLERIEITRKFKVPYIFAILCLLLTIHTSFISLNPLVINGKSLIENKIIKKAFSQTNEIRSDFTTGEIRIADVPESDIDCKRKVVDIVLDINPQYYSGPDSLGAYTSMRRMNALFPAGLDKVDLFVSDIFDVKAYRSLSKIEEINSNRNVVKKVLRDEESFEHLYSCGRLSIFKKTNTLQQSTVQEYPNSKGIISANLVSAEQSLSISVHSSPDINAGNNNVVYTLTKTSPYIANDRVAYWKIVNDDGKIVSNFLDYKYWASQKDWAEESPGYSETNQLDLSFVLNSLESGVYKVLYGFGTFGETQEVYIFDVAVD